MISDAIRSGLKVREIVEEPDGTIRLLTETQSEEPIDPLEAARDRRRASKGQGHEDRLKEAG